MDTYIDDLLDSINDCYVEDLLDLSDGMEMYKEIELETLEQANYGI